MHLHNIIIGYKCVYANVNYVIYSKVNAILFA